MNKGQLPFVPARSFPDRRHALSASFSNSNPFGTVITNCPSWVNSDFVGIVMEFPD